MGSLIQQWGSEIRLFMRHQAGIPMVESGGVHRVSLCLAGLSQITTQRFIN